MAQLAYLRFWYGPTGAQLRNGSSARMSAYAWGRSDHIATGANALVEIAHDGLTLATVAREAPRSIAISVGSEHTTHIMSTARGLAMALGRRALMDSVVAVRSMESDAEMVLRAWSKVVARDLALNQSRVQVGPRFWLCTRH